MKKRKRKKILINRRFQFSFILKFMVVYCAVLIAFFYFMDMFIASEIDSISKSFVRGEAVHQKFRMVIAVISLLSLLVSSALVVTFVMLLSHRIAGPLYRFNIAINDMSRRKFNTLTRIRKKDQFELISDALAKLKHTITADISDINEICTGKGKAKAENRLKQIREITDKYQF